MTNQLRLEGNIKNVSLHILVILGLTTYEIGLLIMSGQPFNKIVMIAYYAVNIAWFYFFSLYLLNDLKKRKWITTLKILLAITSVVGFSIIIIIHNHLLKAIFYNKWDWQISKLEFSRCLWRSIYVSLMAFCFWYARYSIQKVREAGISKRRELELENAFLRSHINPHLMFNSLTHLYENMLEHAPKAAAPVMTMAEMMRYALDTNQPDSMATLKEEIAHINRLITLYQLSENGTVCIQFTNEIKNENKLLPPMLFNHFVENILMYGVLNDIDHPAVIELKETEGNITFITRNKIGGKNRKSHSTGFAHTRKRLENYYPGKHELTITEAGDEFTVELILMA